MINKKYHPVILSKSIIDLFIINMKTIKKFTNIILYLIEYFDKYSYSIKIKYIVKDSIKT